MSLARPSSRRRALLGGASAAATALLAACGAQTGPGAGSQGQFKEAVAIDFQHRWEGVREPLIAQQVEGFAALQPNIKINNQNVYCSGSAEGCYGGMPYDKIYAQIAAGTPPDAFMVQSDYASDFSGKGALRNVSDLARRDKIDLPKTFYPALVQMATYKGSVNGLPQLSAGDSPYLYLSKEVAESAGVDASKPPASWDELVSAAQKMTKRGAGGGGFERIGFGFPESTFQSWMVRNNGKVLSDDATKVQFNSQEGQDTLQWMYNQMTGAFGNWENRQAFYASVASSAPAGGRVAWYTNKVGMWTSGVWHFFEIKGESPTYNPQFQYGVGLVPMNTKNAQAKPASLAESVWLYSIPSGSKRAEATWEWLKHITMGEGNRLFVKAQNRPSPAIKINEDPDFSKDNPHWNTVVKRALEIMSPLPQTRAWPRITPVLGKMTTDVMTGAKGPREALADAAREAQTLLDEAQR
jgi:ABC-type glycerol-3-phosphate transport system substrate-binding protein